MHIGLSSKTMSLMRLSMIAYWKIRARLLRVPGVATSRSGASGCSSSTCTSTRHACARSDVSLDEVMKATAESLDAGLLQLRRLRRRDRHRRLRRHRQPAARDPARAADRHAAGPRPGHRSSERRQAAAHRRRRDGRSRATSRWSATRSSTTGPACCSSSRSCRGPTRCDVTNGVDQALTDLRPGLPGVEIDATIFRPADFIETAIDNLTLRAAARCLLVVADPDRVPVRVAHRADQPGRDSAVADGGRARALPARRRRSTR